MRLLQGFRVLRFVEGFLKALPDTIRYDKIPYCRYVIVSCGIV